MGQKQKRKEVVGEYLKGGVSLREMEAKWGVPRQTIHRWVRQVQEWGDAGEVERLEGRAELTLKQSTKVSDDVRRLQKELEEARLYNELLNTMIDIAEDRLGIDIRKKRGAKR